MFKLAHPRISAELLRQSLRVAQASGAGDLGFALVIVLMLAREARVAGALVWWCVLALAVIARALLARRLLADRALRARHGEDLYTLTAFVESLIWVAGLLLVPVSAPAGAVLQIAISAAMSLCAAFVFGNRVRTWSAYVGPLAIGQALFLARMESPVMLPIVIGWLLTLGVGALFALGLRRTLVTALLLRDRANDATRQVEHAAGELARSREQLRLALDAIDAGVADTNLVSGERFFSSRYAEILGFRDRAAFLATHRFSDALHPEDRSRVLEARRRHLEGGQPFREEFRMRGSDLNTIWVMGRGESVRTDDGRASRFVLSIVDITERRVTELAHAASARQYRALVDAAPSLIWTCDAAGRLSFVSERACRQMYGYAPHEVLGRHVTEFNAPDFSRREFLRRLGPALRGSPVFDAELRHRAASGDILSVTVSALPTRDAAGRLESVIGVATDITALKRRERELSVALRNQQALFDAAGEGIAFVRAGRIDSANGALAKMLGVTREWLRGRPVSEILASPAAWEGVARATVDAGTRNEAAIHELTLRALGAADGAIDGGRTVWCQLTSRMISDVATEFGHAGSPMILVLTDITALKRREELAWHQANHDELTGLPNRRLLVEHARRLLSVAMRQKRLSAVLVLDLDGFKEVNDIFGHSHGDALLRRVALRLSSVLREYDVVARAGGDEFVALLPEIESASIAVVVGEKMIAAATETLEHSGGHLRIHASVGVALFPADGHDFDALLARADAAMYAAKAAGKNQLRLASDASSPAP